jgi:hypothetical protein
LDALTILAVAITIVSTATVAREGEIVGKGRRSGVNWIDKAISPPIRIIKPINTDGT